MLQKKTTQVFIEPVLEERILKLIKIIYHLIRLFMESSKIFLFRFSSSNGMRVTCVCLRCGKHKQDCHHFFQKTAFISICASIYRANTIPWLMC